MTERFAHAIVLVTGASSGIGRAAALEFASQGAKVAILATNRGHLEDVADEIRALGGQCLVLVADVAERAEVEAAVQAILDQWKRLDVFVSNAGYLTKGFVEECAVEDFERQMAVNYLGAVYGIKAALPIMRRQGGGSVVVVSSISGKIHLADTSAYQASKAALRAFTLTLRRELLGSGIGVSLLSPGRTRTNIVRSADVRGELRGQPILGEMPPDRVVREVVACARRPRREVIFPFALKLLALVYALVPDAVERWLPWLQDRWAARRQHDRTADADWRPSREARRIWFMPPPCARQKRPRRS